MNRLAARERFVVPYPEQDRLANAQSCWNWFDTASGRAYGEAGLIMQAIDQVCWLHPVSAMHGRRSTPPLPATPPDMAASWPPLLVIHGRKDPVVALENGQAAAQAWAQAAGIGSGKSRTVQRGRRYAATVTDYQSRGRLAARLVKVDKLGHAWSGGASRQAYSNALGPDASAWCGHFPPSTFPTIQAEYRPGWGGLSSILFSLRGSCVIVSESPCRRAQINKH